MKNGNSNSGGGGGYRDHRESTGYSRKYSRDREDFDAEPEWFSGEIRY